jgi:hypothetical protein
VASEPIRRRIAVKGTGRRTIAGRGSAEVASLDDRPLSIAPSRDGKRIIVALPYEVWILGAATLEVERTIELPSPHPSVFEADEGMLWIGGSHLHRANLFAASATKVGTKLGGFVDHVCLPAPHLLCGVGTQGEVLFDLDKEEVVHRRKSGEHEVHAAVASADGRAVYADGAPHVWVIDPDHASGYMKLKLKATSAVEVPAEGIVTLGTTPGGRVLLGARDGAIGWTNRALRIQGERFPRAEPGLRAPLSIAGDDRFIYVLRPAGILQRFLFEPPKDEPEPGADPHAEPPPEAEECRLPRVATCIAIDHEGRLLLAGPHSDDQLGRLWREDPSALSWAPLKLGTRRLVEAAPPAAEPASKVPSFVATKSKISGSPLSEIKVDDVLAGTPEFWVTRAQGGTLPERPVDVRPAADVLPADALVLPAMIRVHEGTARPALLVWPGVVDDDRPRPPVQWLTWGDDPRGWIPLDTPSLRQQGWSRRGVFPLQIALAATPPEVAGHRAPIPARWVDPELFGALGRECKKLLKVLW